MEAAPTDRLAIAGPRRQTISDERSLRITQVAIRKLASRLVNEFGERSALTSGFDSNIANNKTVPEAHLADRRR
jgi:hypothetical protein